MWKVVERKTLNGMTGRKHQRILIVIKEYITKRRKSMVLILHILIYISMHTSLTNTKYMFLRNLSVATVLFSHVGNKMYE